MSFTSPPDGYVPASLPAPLPPAPLPPASPPPDPYEAEEEQDEIVEELLAPPAPMAPPPEEMDSPAGGRATWIGAPDAPGQADDGISDLFETGTKGEEDDLRDLTSVDVDADIIDADPDSGDLSDLTDVTEEDVLGDEETGQFPDATPARQRMMKQARPVRRITRRQSPPTGMIGLR